jgi:hypothetical protein
VTAAFFVEDMESSQADVSDFLPHQKDLLAPFKICLGALRVPPRTRQSQSQTIQRRLCKHGLALAFSGRYLLPL